MKHIAISPGVRHRTRVDPNIIDTVCIECCTVYPRLRASYELAPEPFHAPCVTCRPETMVIPGYTSQRRVDSEHAKWRYMCSGCGAKRVTTKPLNLYQAACPASCHQLQRSMRIDWDWQAGTVGDVMVPPVMLDQVGLSVWHHITRIRSELLDRIEVNGGPRDDYDRNLMSGVRSVIRELCREQHYRTQVRIEHRNHITSTMAYDLLAKRHKERAHGGCTCRYVITREGYGVYEECSGCSVDVAWKNKPLPSFVERVQVLPLEHGEAKAPHVYEARHKLYLHVRDTGDITHAALIAFMRDANKVLPP